MAGIENNPDKDNHPDVDDGTGDASDEDEMDQQGNEQDWDDWEASGSEGGDEPTASLFEPGKVLATPDAALDYDARQHGFHLLKLAKQVRGQGMVRSLPCLHADDPPKHCSLACACPGEPG
jgi:hypothetical protein